MPLFLILVAVPLIEIALFVTVGGWLGLWPTLGLVVLGALAGTLLIRAQGAAALTRLQSAAAGGGDLGGPLADGAALVVAGMLLVMPGFLTDALGLALMVPGIRQRVVAGAARRMAGRATMVRPGRPARDAPIDAEFEVLDPDPGRAPDAARRGGRPSGWVRDDRG
jgi:UPF0716 protein FxsA